MQQKLSMLLSSFSYQLLQGNLDQIVKNIVFDSRKVTPQALFVCITGHKQDGHQFISEAIANGATAIVVEREVPDVPQNVTLIRVESSRKVLPKLSSIFFGEPSKQVNLIGITGTNGKTSVSFLISKILETTGRKAGVIGTVQNQIGDEIIPFDKTTPTTPESSDLQRLFRIMVDRGAQDIVMEVSSMALELGRVECCSFKLGVFTNFSSDHLDDHGTIENYKKAKLKLFDLCQENIINLDDELALEILKRSHSILTYSIHDPKADIIGKNISIKPDRVEFTITYQNQEQRVSLKIPGKFSVYNALAATGVCLKLGLNLQEIAKGLGSITGVPGRFESIQAEGYTIIIDYAHSADALENVLSTVREFVKGKLITVFGCGGDRDPSKRPTMGNVASKLSDYCILTSDNPRSEDPEKILDDIEEGIPSTHCYKRLVDRKEAIHFALHKAQPGDVVLIAGKGHEDYQEIQGKKIYFNDKHVVQEYFSSKKES